jgi:hypothetical protein
MDHESILPPHSFAARRLLPTWDRAGLIRGLFVWCSNIASLFPFAESAVSPAGCKQLTEKLPKSTYGRQFGGCWTLTGRLWLLGKQQRNRPG